jgi:hypothetical protein
MLIPLYAVSSGPILIKIMASLINNNPNDFDNSLSLVSSSLCLIIRHCTLQKGFAFYLILHRSSQV